MYCSLEGGTSISVGDVLRNSSNNSTTSTTAGARYMIRYRALNTTTGEANTSAPRALAAKSTDSSTLLKVLLRDNI